MYKDDVFCEKQKTLTINCTLVFKMFFILGFIFVPYDFNKNFNYMLEK